MWGYYIPARAGDARKATSNLRKHRVDFEAASTVFLDPLAITLPGPSDSVEERRLRLHNVEASIGFRLGKFRYENVENLPAEFGNVAEGRIPQDLPVQVEVGMHDPVPNCSDLPPRHFRVAILQLNRQAADRLARSPSGDAGRCGHHLILEKRCFGSYCNRRFNLLAGGEYVFWKRRLTPHR